MNNKIVLCVFDFDGVISDKIYVSNAGEITKSYNPKDSYGLQLLKNKNIKIGVVTGCETTCIDHMEKITKRIDYISKGNYNKIDKINEWCNELNINLKNVAYIGDDIFDAIFMDQLGYTGCPNDAVKECKEKASYICENKGGNGAVREFINKVIEYNENVAESQSEEYKNLRMNGKITAIIPVRSGSTRCKNKNIREFGDTNLLKRKIEILKQVSEIDEIIVSSNCDEMLQIALDCGVKIDKRPQEYANTDTPGYLFFEYLAKKIQNPIFMYVHAVCPFVTNHNLRQMIKIFREKTEYDSVNSSCIIKHFMYMNKRALNYNNLLLQNSQSLPDIYIPTFCPMILTTEFVKKYKTLIGFNPYFYELSQIEGIDIDTPYDFIISELLYKNNFHDNDDIVKYLNRVDNTKTELLDCTIRDGGYINDWNFTENEVLECYKAVSESGYDYFEIGFMRTVYDEKHGKWYSVTCDDIKNITQQYKGCKIAVMISVEGNENIELEHSEITQISLIRLHLRLSADTDQNCNIMKNTINLAEKYSGMGYEICLNLASSDKYDDQTIEYIINKVKHLKLKTIYIADTFGNLNEEKTLEQLYKFQKKLYLHKCETSLSIHLHNNMQNALSKAKKALEFRVSMIDSTIYGLGRGAGNLQSELLLLEQNTKHKYDKYNILPIIEYGDKYIRKFNDCYINSQFNYGINILYIVSGYLNIHPDYVKYLCEKYNDRSVTHAYNCLLHIKKNHDNDIFSKKNVDDFMDQN